MRQYFEDDGTPRDTVGVRNPYVRFRPLRKPPPGPMATTLWDYPSQHYGRDEQGSSRYRGATPSYVIWNVVERYCPLKGVVLDPFCGSGTTLDVCKDLGRIGIGFDVVPSRPDIQKGDARKLPLDDQSVDVVFFDPPYADNLDYSDSPNCIGKLRGDDGTWADAMKQVIDEAYRVLKAGGVMAMFVCDVLHAHKAFYPLGLQLATLAASKMDIIDHVAVVRHARSLDDGGNRKTAIDNQFYLRGFSHLVLCQKPRQSTAGKGTANDVTRGSARSTVQQTHNPLSVASGLAASVEAVTVPAAGASMPAARREDARHEHEQRAAYAPHKQKDPRQRAKGGYQNPNFPRPPKSSQPSRPSHSPRKP